MVSNNLSELLASLTGCWKLVDFTATSVSDPNDISYPSGHDPKGTIMYTTDGYMSADLLAPGQKPFAPQAVGEATDAEYAESARRYMSYSGPFTVTTDEKGRPMLVHDVYVSLSPGLLGVGQKRLVEISGDEMVLRPVEALDYEGAMRDFKVVWKRMPKNDPLSE